MTCAAFYVSSASMGCIFSRRARGRGAVTGVVASVALLTYVQRCTELHFFAYSAIGFLSCFAIGWIASLLTPGPAKDLAGLTAYSSGE
jgi:hypothetical protein